jgi:hypothetical protein
MLQPQPAALQRPTQPPPANCTTETNATTACQLHYRDQHSHRLPAALQRPTQPPPANRTTETSSTTACQPHYRDQLNHRLPTALQRPTQPLPASRSAEAKPATASRITNTNASTIRLTTKPYLRRANNLLASDILSDSALLQGYRSKATVVSDAPDARTTCTTQ